jgi:hypothetical protein
VDVGTLDRFAVDLGNDLDGAVRGRVRRPDVDHDVVRIGGSSSQLLTGGLNSTPLTYLR